MNIHLTYTGPPLWCHSFIQQGCLEERSKVIEDALTVFPGTQLNQQQGTNAGSQSLLFTLPCDAFIE